MKLSMSFEFDSLEEATRMLSRFGLQGAEPNAAESATPPAALMNRINQGLPSAENDKADDFPIAPSIVYGAEHNVYTDPRPAPKQKKPKFISDPVDIERPHTTVPDAVPYVQPAITITPIDPNSINIGLSAGDALRTYAKKHGLVKASELLASFGAKSASTVTGDDMTAFLLACSL